MLDLPKKRTRNAITMLNDTINVLSELVKNLPVGTNLSLLHVLWTLLSGALLTSRGALIPALASTGLNAQATRRAWGAVRYGQWQIAELLREWQVYVRGLAGWTVARYEGYRALTVDVTAFWRPTLKGCPSQHYHPAAGRALPAVIIGLVGEVGRLNGQRLALPRLFARVHPQDGREARLWQMLLKQVARLQRDDEIVVVDAGVNIRDLQEAGITRYVVRLATNFTAQRNVLPEHTRGRKPTYGRLVRPLARRFKDNQLPATPPDECQSWTAHKRTFRAEIWRGLVLPKTVPNPDNLTFDVYAIYDPDFAHPWLLATTVPRSAQSIHALYADRWPVEQLPLSAKQMLGAHRQFVHHPQTIQRLPELTLLAGSVLSVLAASLPAFPTGFWDTRPKPTPGRLRRQLFGRPFPQDVPLPPQFREKKSKTDHLPKGFRPKTSPSPVFPASTPPR
jgi:hypothetical protein